MSEHPVSRVLHLRLRNSTVLSCHKLLELQQGTFDIPMSTMVVTILDNLVAKLIDSGKLPNVSDEAAGTMLDSIYRKDGIEDESELEEPDLLDTFLDDIEVEDKSIEENLSLHQVPLDKEFQKRSPDEQQEIEEEINYPDIPPWNDMANSKLLTFQILMIKAPKDILIENAVDNKNIHLQRAVQIVYSTIPQDMWGSSKAQQLVAEVLPMVEHYLGPVPVKEE